MILPLGAKGGVIGGYKWEGRLVDFFCLNDGCYAWDLCMLCVGFVYALCRICVGFVYTLCRVCVYFWFDNCQYSRCLL